MLQYADDIYGLLANIKSAKLFLKQIEQFSVYSGLQINKEKSEGMWLGSLRKKHKQSIRHETDEGNYLEYLSEKRTFLGDGRKAP